MTDVDSEEHKASIHPQQLAGMQRESLGKEGKVKDGSQGAPRGQGRGEALKEDDNVR